MRVNSTAKDIWTHYYLALVKFRASQVNQKPFEGVSNMIQDLVLVVDKEPDMAEAHNMLALARLQGGGVHSATEPIKVAIQLSPRNEQYVLNLAQIDLAGKKWDDATALLERLKDSLNPQIAEPARKNFGRPAHPEEVWRITPRRFREPASSFFQSGQGRLEFPSS